jgi:hypothetical protein
LALLPLIQVHAFVNAGGGGSGPMGDMGVGDAPPQPVKEETASVKAQVAMPIFFICPFTAQH